METQNKAAWIGLLAAAMFALHISSHAEGLGLDKNLQSVESAYSMESSAEGIGTDQQDAVSKAAELIQQGKLADAESVLDGVLSRFASLMGDNKQTYVSFRENRDYQQFLKEHQARQGDKPRMKVTRMHVSFTQALQLKAYIASSQEQWDKAMEYLDRKIAHAPYEAQPYLERGYILTARGKPRQSYDTYKTGYALAVAHNAVKPEQAAALRGMGSAKIELGELDEATEIFRKSLEIEPANETALSELKYIEEMKATGR